MARLITSGFEIDVSPSDGPGPDGVAYSGVNQSSVVRSGSRAILTGAAGTDFAWTGATNRNYYGRSYCRIIDPPSLTSPAILAFYGSGATLCYVTVNTDRTLNLVAEDGASGTNTTSYVLPTGTWVRLELRVYQSTTAGADECELKADGVTVAALNGFTFTSANAPTQFTVSGYNNSAVPKTYHDDVAVNDDQGADQNFWPGDGKVVLLVPISDNNRGSWTGGAGGTTNLYDAINNTPPIGTATETNTSQIESADNSGDNSTDEGKFNLTTYSDAGIGPADVIAILYGFINHGEDVSTNTKTGSFGGQANPSWTYDTFTFGENSGALGTYPTNWRWTLGAPQYIPSVTVGSSPVMAVRKTDTGTRVASVDFMGMYVEYFTPTTTIFNPNTIVAPNIYPSQVIQQRSRW